MQHAFNPVTSERWSAPPYDKSVLEVCRVIWQYPSEQLQEHQTVLFATSSNSLTEISNLPIPRQVLIVHGATQGRDFFNLLGINLGNFKDTLSTH